MTDRLSSGGERVNSWKGVDRKDSRDSVYELPESVNSDPLSFPFFGTLPV